MTSTTGTALIADIGGTNARFALVIDGRLARSEILACKDHASLEEVAAAFLDQGPPEEPRPARGAFAVAGPILSDQVALTNLPWAFSIQAVRRALGLDQLDVVNDFVAVAHAAPVLRANATAGRNRGAAGLALVRGAFPGEDGAPIAVLGPGSGLGVGSIVPIGNGRWHALPGEGGHVTMAAATEREAEVLLLLRRHFAHVSAERVLSGPGLVNLYSALAELDGTLTARPNAEAISKAGRDGTDPVAVEALAMFAAMLGTVASDLALTVGATGGVYIAGGIVPSLGDWFLETSGFAERFVDKGRFRDYLTPIPVSVVTEPLPAFVGLQAILAQDAT